MKRGEIWTAAGGGDYTGKPRPVVIVQDDAFDATDSITVCPITGDPTDVPMLRIALEPTSDNGLTEQSRVMADKVTTVRRSRLDQPVGRLSEHDLARLTRALIVFLGLAARP
jgi:mRNA interferase MazF